MGGKPLVALNIVGFPAELAVEMLGDVLKGGYDKAMEANCLIVGGHTVDDAEPKYGLSVVGLIEPGKEVSARGMDATAAAYLDRGGTAGRAHAQRDAAVAVLGPQAVGVRRGAPPEPQPYVLPQGRHHRRPGLDPERGGVRGRLRRGPQQRRAAVATRRRRTRHERRSEQTDRASSHTRKLGVKAPEL